MQLITKFDASDEVNEVTMEEIHGLISEGIETRRGYLPTVPEEVEARVSANNQVMLSSLDDNGCDSLRIYPQGNSETVEVMFRVASNSGADGQSRFIDLGLHGLNNGIQFRGHDARNKARALIEKVDAGLKAGLFREKCQVWIGLQADKFRSEAIKCPDNGDS